MIKILLCGIFMVYGTQDKDNQDSDDKTRSTVNALNIDKEPIQREWDLEKLKQEMLEARKKKFDGSHSQKKNESNQK